MSKKRLFKRRGPILWGIFAVVSVAGIAFASRPSVPPGEANRPPKAGPGTLPTVDLNTITPSDLVNTLLGAGATASNIVYSGASIAAGTFSGGTGIIGFESGVILSSGNVATVAGPDNIDDGSTTNNGLPGDADLDALIPGFTTFDATILEFDFECTGVQTIQFQYVFSSEEYNEYVFSSFNDVFGFFLNGTNIAVVPGGGATPVAIDNVNCDNPYNPPSGNNCNLFRNNDCSDIPPNTFPCSDIDTEMDGLTLVFTASGTLLPGVNHIKLAIADAGDQVLDSNVFIKAESFACADPTGACCNRATFTCAEDVLEADCQGANEEWYAGLSCANIDPPCAPTGACCLEDESCVITNAATCASIAGAGDGYQGDDTLCDPNPCTGPIPAVSEWGLVVLTLLGCIVGTVLFRATGRRSELST